MKLFIVQRYYTIGCCFCLTSADAKGKNEITLMEQIEEMMEINEKIKNSLQFLHLRPMKKCLENRLFFWVQRLTENEEIYLNYLMNYVSIIIEDIKTNEGIHLLLSFIL